MTIDYRLIDLYGQRCTLEGFDGDTFIYSARLSDINYSWVSTLNGMVHTTRSKDVAAPVSPDEPFAFWTDGAGIMIGKSGRVLSAENSEFKDMLKQYGLEDDGRFGRCVVANPLTGELLATAPTGSATVDTVLAAYLGFKWVTVSCDIDLTQHGFYLLRDATSCSFYGCDDDDSVAVAKLLGIETFIRPYDEPLFPMEPTEFGYK